MTNVPQQPSDPAAATILLVDDNALLLKQAESYLSQRGLNVLCNDSPFGVGRLLLRHRPAVAVIDVMMPGLDGPNLVAALAQQGAHLVPPVIFYSAMEEEQLYKLCRATPGAQYVLKSDGLAALYDAIKRTLATPR